MLCDAKKEKGKDKENDVSSLEMLAATRTHARIAKNNARASPLNLPSPPHQNNKKRASETSLTF